MTGRSNADHWRADLRTALKAAMKARDAAATSAIRSALSAIDNAEAVDVANAPTPEAGTIAGGVSGLGAAEVARRELSAADVESLVRHEVTVRIEAADEYDRLGRSDQAQAVRSEAAVLDGFLQSE